MSSYFSDRWPLSYLNLIKNMKTYIRRQQHKKFKHQDIKQKEPPQKYRLGTISNTKLLVGLNRFYRILTSPSASANLPIFNPRPFRPNMNSYTKFEENRSINAQDRARKRNADGRTDRQTDRRTDGQTDSELHWHFILFYFFLPDATRCKSLMHSNELL